MFYAWDNKENGEKGGRKNKKGQKGLGLRNQNLRT